MCRPNIQMISFKKQRYFIHKTTSRKLFKMAIDIFYFNQVKKLFFTFIHRLRLFYWYMHFIHILIILLLVTPSWSETCRILMKNNSRGLPINNAFCWFWARSRSRAKKQLALSCSSVHLSVCPHVSARLPLDEFTLNIILVIFMETSVDKIQILLRIGTNIRHFRLRTMYFLLLPATLNSHKRALLERNGVRLLG